MSNFIYDDTGLNGPKSDLAPLPVGANANQWVQAADWNQVRQALLDIQTVMKGNQLVIASPVGANNFIKWLSGATDTGILTDQGFIFDTIADFSFNGTNLISFRTGGNEVASLDAFGDFTTAFSIISWGGQIGGGGVQANNSAAYPWINGTHFLNLVANQVLGYNDVMSSAPSGGGGANTLRLYNRKSDGAFVYHVVDTQNSITDAAATLWSLRNGGVEQVAIDKSGTILPGTDLNKNLGSSTKRWNEARIETVYGSAHYSTDFGSLDFRVYNQSGSSAVTVRVSSAAPFTSTALAANTELINYQNGPTKVYSFDANTGVPHYLRQDSSTTTPTCNTAMGHASITSGSTITIANAQANANAGVLTQVEALGTGPTRVSTAVCSAGFITITMDAATTAGTTTVFWMLQGSVN